VHPVKLRGVLSEGLFYRPAAWPAHGAEGQDVAAEIETVAARTAGRSTLAGHIREGVVIEPLAPRLHDELGRVMLKSVSPDYLTRKSGTEYQ